MQQWRVTPGNAIDLSAIDTASTIGAPGDKATTIAATKDLRDRLGDLQVPLYAERKQSLLVVLQAIDGGGKDGTIRKVFRGVNPQGCRVTSFKQPTDRELSHDFLWRVHQAAPEHGEIGVFNRSHYEDVLVVRVKDLVPEDVWRRRYNLINGFERTLTEAGTRIVKFFLHISKEEQAARFEGRRTNPEKQWKFNVADLEERKYWDAYQAAFRDMLEHTSTDIAPWCVIPADRKWYRNFAVASVLVATLEDTKPRFPAAKM